VQRPDGGREYNTDAAWTKGLEDMIQDPNGIERMLEDVKDECAGESRPACERGSDGLRIREVGAARIVALMSVPICDASVFDE
jgi:hypothetical protein